MVGLVVVADDAVGLVDVEVAVRLVGVEAAVPLVRVRPVEVGVNGELRGGI